MKRMLIQQNCLVKYYFDCVHFPPFLPIQTTYKICPCLIPSVSVYFLRVIFLLLKKISKRYSATSTSAHVILIGQSTRKDLFCTDSFSSSPLYATFKYFNTFLLVSYLNTCQKQLLPSIISKEVRNFLCFFSCLHKPSSYLDKEKYSWFHYVQFHISAVGKYKSDRLSVVKNLT